MVGSIQRIEETREEINNIQNKDVKDKAQQQSSTEDIPQAATNR
jgi:hypothetical protein